MLAELEKACYRIIPNMTIAMAAMPISSNSVTFVSGKSKNVPRQAHWNVCFFDNLIRTPVALTAVIMSVKLFVRDG
jgi:hypothetical protein